MLTINIVIALVTIALMVELLNRHDRKLARKIRND